MEGSAEPPETADASEDEDEGATEPASPAFADELTKLRCEAQLKEFEALKAEQVQRIGFRDNMLYVTLVVVGAIAAYALEGGQNDTLPGLRRHALLVVPWICVVLGWTSVMNDEKITAIGDYIKKPGGLGDALHATLGCDRAALFRWEDDHRSDDYRRLRKLFQLAVDLTTFVASGAAAMYVFHSTSGAEVMRSEVRTLMYVEGVFLTLLAGWIVKYSGVWTGGPKPVVVTSRVVTKRVSPR